ncbi:MAG: hypothetical protein JW881_00425 [Spirochaetales bacterium]|nr:hypothetical protein [Spirochaetales bacterium]
MYQPLKAFDNDITTGWLENVDGPGIGEYIHIVLSEAITADEIMIAPGYFDPKWWKTNNRIKKMEIAANGKKIVVVFNDAFEMKRVKLDTPLMFKEMSFTIMDVCESKKDNDSGISEIIFFRNNKAIPLQ